MSGEHVFIVFAEQVVCQFLVLFSYGGIIHVFVFDGLFGFSFPPIYDVLYLRIICLWIISLGQNPLKLLEPAIPHSIAVATLNVYPPLVKQ